MEILRTPLYVLERAVGKSYFALRRTSAKVDSLTELVKQLDQVDAAIAKVAAAHLNILFDLRLAPIRSDPEFYRVVRPYLMRYAKQFKRVAVVVKTQVGKLQINQVSRNMLDGVPHVFDDEQAAIAYLEGKE